MRSVILGDSLLMMEEIPSETFDVIATDPPYGMGFQSGHRSTKYDRIVGDDNISFVPRMFSELYRLAKMNTHTFVFCSKHHLDAFVQAARTNYDAFDVLVWLKNNTSMGDLESQFAPRQEFIIHARKGRSLIIGKRRSQVFEHSITGSHLHPTQKPVGLMIDLLSSVARDRGLVFDPFAGSGTTGVAAAHLGLDFLGFEIVESYARIANARILEASGQVRLNLFTNHSHKETEENTMTEETVERRTYNLNVSTIRRLEEASKAEGLRVSQFVERAILEYARVCDERRFRAAIEGERGDRVEGA